MKIDIDVNAKTMKTDKSWQEGIGGDHAWQFHRSDMVEQLKFAHDELGIKSIRFHGIFDDDMWTISDLNAFSPIPGGRYVRDYNFRQIGHVYDNILSCGVKPFVELSFMPSQLAKKKVTGLHYRNNTSIPKDYNEWHEYIKAFIEFLINRYGLEEVLNWKFEVWNEPDLKGGFFAYNQEDYFKLYEVSARAIKEVHKDIKVGGPSTSACKWIEEFINYCRNNNVPLDFISTHHYPGDAFGNLITPSNYFGIFKTMKKAIKERADLTNSLGKMFFDPEKAARVPKDALVKMDDDLYNQAKDYPIYISEWNSMAIFAAPIHDEKYSAAFVCKSVLDLNNKLEGYFFWCLSDLFEEQIQLNKPFIGGYGILTNDGIPKPNFYAFKLLSKLYDERLDIGFREFKDVEYGIFKNGDNLQILLVAHNNDPRVNDKFEIEININGIYMNAYEERIDDNHCNPKKLWMNMGSPINLRKEEVKKIKEESNLNKEKIEIILNDSKTTIKTNLYTNDIVLITLEKGDQLWSCQVINEDYLTIIKTQIYRNVNLEIY